MGRIYKLSGDITSYAGNDGANVFLQIECAANKLIYLNRFRVGQSTSIVDQANVLHLVKRSAAQTGGTVINAETDDDGDAADSATITEQPTIGAPSDTVKDRWGISMIAGLEHIWIPDDRPIISGAAVWGFRIVGTLTTPVTLEYSLSFEEIG